MRLLRPSAALLAAVVLAALSAAPAQAAVPLRRLVGERLVIAMSGTRPDAALLARVRAGRVGGVILFGSNIASPSQVSRLTARLRAAARAGGYLPPLVMTDQEGGEVRRIPWAPPTLTPPQLGARNDTVTARRQGGATARALRALGIDVDLAPVADVPRTPASFIARQGRAYSSSRFVVARMAGSFAVGLDRGGVAATMKHFPGLGWATQSTDDTFVRIDASRRAIERDILPYRVGTRRGLPLVMLSTAVYPALDFRAAAWSPPVIRLLRHDVGFRGVTITDSLDAAAGVRHLGLGSVALRSARAGADLLLVTGSEAASAAVEQRLGQAARTGRLPRSQLVASYRRIRALQQRYAVP